MTIEKARKLLGNKYKNLSDVEVQSKINSLGKFAESLVDAVLEKIGTINPNETSSYPSKSVFNKTSLRR